MDHYIKTDSTGHLQMTFGISEGLRSNFYLSLHIKKGTWFHDPNFGSLLHEIKTLTESDLNLAKSYAFDALKWMIDIGKLKSINVETSVDQSLLSGSKTLKISISAVDSLYRPIKYETYFRVV